MAGWFDGFDAGFHPANGQHLFVRTGGRRDGPPLLLLHGFPQTHAIWHRVAVQLADEFFLVMPDLRGYGASSKPAGGGDHADYSKRAMARDLAELMRKLGHATFAVCGHDRGGRVAHRLALDHPDAVTRLCLLDIAPTLDMYAATDMVFATAYYHWFHLIQPEPLPERMIGGDLLGYLRAPSSAAGVRQAPRSWSPTPWPPTKPPSCPPPSTRCARTTAPQRRHRPGPRPRVRARPARRSAATCTCCGANAAWCTSCSTRWRCGRRSAPARSRQKGAVGTLHPGGNARPRGPGAARLLLSATISERPPRGTWETDGWVPGDFETEKAAFRAFHDRDLRRLEEAKNAFSALVRALVMHDGQIAVSKVEGRIKDPEECINKFDLKYRAELERNGTPYAIRDHVTDLIGLRIVCLYEDDIEKLRDQLASHFEVIEVTDNGERTAPAAFNDSDEIQVTRRIEREQGSIYRINGKESRAKDVQLLFADASTGARSPSMVGQGRASVS